MICIMASRKLSVLCVAILLLIILLYSYTKNVDEYFDPIPKISLNSVLANAKTGDLILFWSDNAKYSWSGYPRYITASLQAWATETPYTHVCVVYRRGDSTDDLHLITSGRHPTETGKTGNQIFKAEQYMREYKGRLCWYPINRKLSKKRVDAALQQFRANYHHGYNTNILMFINLGLQLWENRSVPEKTICSTTVWDFLITTGVIDSNNSYSKMNRANIGLRELEAAAIESEYYDLTHVREVFI